LRQALVGAVIVEAESLLLPINATQRTQSELGMPNNRSALLAE
jgi:hypothetical protein